VRAASNSSRFTECSAARTARAALCGGPLAFFLLVRTSRRGRRRLRNFGWRPRRTFAHGNTSEHLEAAGLQHAIEAARRRVRWQPAQRRRDRVLGRIRRRVAGFTQLAHRGSDRRVNRLFVIAADRPQVGALPRQHRGVRRTLRLCRLDQRVIDRAIPPVDLVYRPCGHGWLRQGADRCPVGAGLLRQRVSSRREFVQRQLIQAVDLGV
jgi:hypothetical protein